MFNRREMLARIAAAALAGPLGLEAAGGVYQPKALTQHEFETLKKLCELIVPGATKGGAAEFIDVLSSQNPEMSAIYTGGIAWLDEEMKRTYHADFLTATAEQKTGML